MADMMLETRGVSKAFGALRANDGVDLKVAAGQVHAVLGENGAGKSTLMKLLYGALRPDAGEILWRGAPVRLDGPAAARRLGVGMVFQHFALFESLSVRDNLALTAAGGDEAEAAAAAAARYGLSLDLDALVADLSAGERQRVEIARCLGQDPQLIILDEPTSVLAPQEADALFEWLRRFADEGRAILYISHKLDEVRRICDAATVLRRGRVVGVCDPRERTPEELARMMVGEGAATATRRAPPATSDAAPALAARGLSLPAATPFATALDDVSFELRRGEVAAVAGVAGEGQAELFEALSGERLLAQADHLKLLGRPVGRLGPTERRRLGAAFVSDDRLGHGAVPDRRLSENLLLTRAAIEPSLSGGGLLRYGAARRAADRIATAFDVRRGETDPSARSLSGGNLQKFLMGREIDRAPEVLIVHQPTAGVDAAAAARIRSLLVERARAGAAVLVIGQDLDEIFEIADRIAVIYRGRVSAFRPANETSRDAVGLLMVGHAADPADGETASDAA